MLARINFRVSPPGLCLNNFLSTLCILLLTRVIKFSYKNNSESRQKVWNDFCSIWYLITSLTWIFRFSLFSGIVLKQMELEFVVEDKEQIWI